MLTFRYICKNGLWSHLWDLNSDWEWIMHHRWPNHIECVEIFLDGKLTCEIFSY